MDVLERIVPELFRWMSLTQMNVLSWMLIAVVGIVLGIIIERWYRERKRAQWIFKEERRLCRELSAKEREVFLRRIPRGFWGGVISALRGERDD